MNPHHLLIACIMPFVSAGTPVATEAAPPTCVVVRAELKPVIRLKGTVLAAQTSEFHLRPRAFQGPWRVVSAAVPGPVKAGADIVQFDTGIIERDIRDARTHLQDVEARVNSLDAGRRLFEIQGEVEEAQARLQLRDAEEELKAYMEYDSKTELPRVELDKRYSDHYLSLQEEELRQLDDMYRKNELAESTRDYVIERERRNLELHKEGLKLSETERARRIALDIPKVKRNLEERVESLKLENKLRSARMAASKADMKLQELQLSSELAQSRERLADLQADLELHSVMASEDGVLAISIRPGDEVQNGSMLASLHLGGGTLVEAMADEPLLLTDVVEASVRHLGRALKATPLSSHWQPDDGSQPKWLVTLRLEGELPLGAPVSIMISGEPRQSVLTLERSGLSWGEDRVTARRILPGGGTETVEVCVGAANDGKVEIVEGLVEGDRVEKLGD